MTPLCQLQSGWTGVMLGQTRLWGPPLLCDNGRERTLSEGLFPGAGEGGCPFQLPLTTSPGQRQLDTSLTVLEHRDQPL